MQEGSEGERWAGYADWRGRPALRGKHGGMLAASFVLVVEVLENLAFLANASNLMTYMGGNMHFSSSMSATTVTNFMGTAFLLALLGGFLSDAFYTTYVVYIASAIVEFLGLTMLTIQARSSKLKPPSGQEATGANAVMLYTGLYLTALGIGGIKGSLPSHGAEQLDQTTPRGSANRSTFFNYFVFSLSCGALVAVTLVVWLEDNRGWQWGFAVSTLSILLSIPAFLSGSSLYRTKIPSGSPLTVIAKALAAKLLHEMPQPPQEFLKVFVKILPIFASTIMLSCCLAQLSTFSVQQAAMMDTLLGNFAVAPASLPVFPVVFVMILTPIYDRIVIPFARKLTGIESGITQLQRIGIGLALSVLAMAVAALVEAKRKHASNSTPISFLWVAPQYLFLGSAVLFTLAGLLEFFFAEAPEGIRSLATSLPWASLAMGYYLSSVLVSVVRSATGHGGRGCQPWLAGSNLNSYQLDRFYWLLCGLSLVNFGLYLFWAVRYKYRVKAGR